MSAITLINDVPSSTSPSAEFRVSQGTHQIARIGVHAGGRASIPTISQPGTPVEIVPIVDENNNAEVNTAQPWTIYAIVNGITTPTVAVTNPNATVTVTPDNNDDGFTLTVS